MASVVNKPAWDGWKSIMEGCISCHIKGIGICVAWFGSLDSTQF